MNAVDSPINYAMYLRTRVVEVGSLLNGPLAERFLDQVHAADRVWVAERLEEMALIARGQDDGV